MPRTEDQLKCVQSSVTKNPLFQAGQEESQSKSENAIIINMDSDSQRISWLFLQDLI